MTNKELTKIRKEKNMTKGQFAALIGISPMMQGRYEGGKIMIPEEIAEKVMAIGKEEEKKKVKVEKNDASKKIEKVAKDTKKKPEKKAASKKAEKKITRKKTPPTIHIQSMLGGTISYDELIMRIPADAEAVYVKPEENKAYWVKGDETGDVDLW